MADKYDVLAIGNAIVDVLVKVEDEFLAKHGLAKGSMNLIDEDKALELYQDMPKGEQVSGGSAANTIAGVASFGGKTAYIGKVRDDELGEFFTKDMNAGGIDYKTSHAKSGARTAFSLIFVTPDAERTMATYLGATRGMTTADVDSDLIGKANITYLEGYLWDEPAAIEAMIKAMHVVHEHGGRVAFTLSDLFCVDRHRDAFLETLSHIDILFANEDEIKSLYQEDDFETAILKAQGVCDIIAVTRSEQGSVVLANDEVIRVPAENIDQLVDTTGAGDMYAAGFLYALSQNLPLEKCARYGSVAASSVIQHMGARPKQVYADLVKQLAA